MDVTVKWFSAAVREELVEVGELVRFQDGARTWLGFKFTNPQQADSGWVILDGPAGERENGWPGFVDEGAIQATLLRLPLGELVVEPIETGRLPEALSDEPGHGDLIIDAAGEPWIVVVAHARYTARVSLDTGTVGNPTRPVAAYDAWQLSLRDGKERVILATFGID